MIVSLEALKNHLNITTDFEDVLLTAKLETAQVAVANFIGVDLTATYTSYLDAVYGSTDPFDLITLETQSNAPAPIKEAVLQYGAYLYEYREPVVTGERAQPLPLGIFDLVGNYKVWNF